MIYAVAALSLLALAALAALVAERKRADASREVLLKEMALERGALLQRIQAPEVAVSQFAERPKRERPMIVPVNDDAAYAEAMRMRNGDSE